MDNLKTKFDKHTNDNEKRRRSIRDREKTRLHQSLIIKQALSNATLHDNSTKKIKFNDEENINSGKTNGSKIYLNENGKSLLFNNSESESEDIEIKEKIQFSGEKGFELLNLQSTYGNDERFQIDERFLEDEKKNFYQEKDKTPNCEVEDNGEKVKQLRVLESVLGTSIIKPDQGKKLKKRAYEMIRYDTSNKDHEIYEINTQSESLNSILLSKKKKERNKIPKVDTGELTKPKVSKEKFYKVSNEIKNCFKEKKEENVQFSLLQTYGLNGVGNNLGIEEDVVNHEKDHKEDLESGFVEEEHFKKSNNYKVIKGINEKMIDEPVNEDRNKTVQGIWKESFFFIQEDPRIKEGLEFINKKDSVEASEAAENYDQMRKKLKEILRLHLKKYLLKKNPFKKKIGGMNKKQLANSKFKNPKMLFNKRKSYKKNPVGRI